jgi:succinate dehydrogenase/fumarate reductase cytochrome b subunit
MPAESSRRTIRTERTAFVLRRLSSLAGVLPLGVFVLFHVGSQARVLFRGIDASAARLPSTGWLWAQSACVLLPLLAHALIETAYLRARSSNTGHYPFTRNWAWLLQRISGFIALAFVIWHVVVVRLPLFRGATETDVSVELAASLSSTGFGGVPYAAIGHLLGLAAVVYHLFNGIHGFCFTWGILASRDAGRRVSRWLALSGLLVYVVAAAIVVYFATGSLPFGGA